MENRGVKIRKIKTDRRKKRNNKKYFERVIYKRIINYKLKLLKDV